MEALRYPDLDDQTCRPAVLKAPLPAQPLPSHPSATPTHPAIRPRGSGVGSGRVGSHRTVLSRHAQRSVFGGIFCGVARFAREFVLAAYAHTLLLHARATALETGGGSGEIR